MMRFGDDDDDDSERRIRSLSKAGELERIRFMYSNAHTHHIWLEICVGNSLKWTIEKDGIILFAIHVTFGAMCSRWS